MISRDEVRTLLGAAKSHANDLVWFATGIVSEVRLEDRRIRVKVLPEELETNWLRVFWPLAGPDYMIGALPEIGTEIACLFVSANPNHVYVIGGGTFDDDDVPPEVSSDYDLMIKPKAGGYIKIEKDIGITIFTGNDVVVNALDGKVTVNSPHVHLGDESGGKVLTSTTFMPKYNADMALLMAHTNLVAPDPTLATIGNATEIAHAATKTDAS